jgi:hypothetical protein
MSAYAWGMSFRCLSIQARRAGVLTFGLVLVCALGVGCRGGTGVWVEKNVLYPFAPASVRIHPLTHLDRDKDGKAVLICHIQLLDPWGESVRGVGNLKVSLFGPGRSVPTQDALWSFDLNDLKTNNAMYDPATRTYRLQLGKLPAWTQELGSEKGNTSSGSIYAELTMLGLNDQTVTVSGRAVLRR